MAVRRKRITFEQLEEILQILEQMPIDIDRSDSADLLRLPHLARKHDLTTYDAAYLNLAFRDKLPLATNDKDLRKAAIAEGVPII
jgi:predicted nucleic acid-binding protein